MSAKRSNASRAREVAFGTAQEHPVLKRWLATRPAGTVAMVLKSARYHDFDFALFDKRGLPLAYVEIKVRRSALARFGDAICPMRKHEFAKDLKARAKLPFYLVTEYGCGSIVEVELSKAPSKVLDITRHDRPGEAVPHAVYAPRQLKVVRKGMS